MNDQQRPRQKRTRQRRQRTGDRTLGIRIRKARDQLGLTQEQAAHQIGRSGRWLLLVENGRADPGYGDLVNLAPVLETDIGKLVLGEEQPEASTKRETITPAPVKGQTEVTTVHEAVMMRMNGRHDTAGDWLEQLRRRGFLRAGLIVSGAAALGLWPTLESAGDDVSEMASVRRALLYHGPEKAAEPPDLVALKRSVYAAWTDLQESRYSTVRQAVPSLLAAVRFAVQELDGVQRAAGYELLARTFLLVFNLLRKVGDTNLATVAADRGLLAARCNGSPAVVADAAGCLGIMLSDGGHHSEAIELCTTTASDLEPEAMRSRDSSLLSVYGQVLLSAAEAAAQARDRQLSDDIYREAARVARRLGQDANHSFTAFGPTNVTVHRVHAAVVLGESERAVRMAQDVDVLRLPVLERRAHHLLDVAIGYGRIDKPESALDTLLAAESIAPEEVHLDAQARMLVHDLRLRNHQHGSRLRDLCQRMLPPD